MRLIVLIMHVADGFALENLAILGVPHQARDLHAARLGGFVLHHDADFESLGHVWILVFCVSWSYFAAAAVRARSPRIVWHLAISRRCRLSSLEESRRSVCALIRKRNRFSDASFQVSRICSSLISRSSDVLAIAQFSRLLTHSRARLPIDPHIARRFKNRTRTGILWASRAKHIRAASSDSPLTSYRIVPGLMTAAQNSGSPFPLPMRVSKGIEVIDLCGNTRT